MRRNISGNALSIRPTVDAAEIENALGALSSCDVEQIPSLIARSAHLVSTLSPTSAVDRDRALPLVELAASRLEDFLRRGLETGQISLTLNCLAIPTMRERWGADLSGSASWHELHTLAARAFAGRQPHLVYFLQILIIEACIIGTANAFPRFIARFAGTDFSTLVNAQTFEVTQLGEAFRLFGWLEPRAPELPATIAKVLEQQRQRGATPFADFVLGMLQLLRFQIHMPSDWLDFLVQTLAVPALKAAGEDAQHANLALQLDRLLYLVVLKKKDTAENFRRLYAAIAPPLAAAGARLGKEYSKLPLPSDWKVRPKVAFFIWGDFSTAHAGAAIMFFRGLVELENTPIEPFVFVWDTPGPNLTYLLNAVEGLGVTVRWPIKPIETNVDQVLWLRAQAEADKISALVFVSVTMTICFAAALPVAPVNIWWTLKYHDLHTPQIQGYIAQGLFGRHAIELGPEWRITDVSAPTLFDDSLTAEGERLARLHSDNGRHVILGCLGRSEKLLDPRYVQALGRILRACPEAIYLYTGRDQRPEFLAMLAEEGIGDRCQFIGWVSTKLYAHVLDLQVDSFPFASGITTMEVMSAGRPVVTLITRESLETSAATYFVPTYRGEIGAAEDHEFVREIFTEADGSSFFPFLETPEQYEAFAIRMIRDPSLRARVGSSCRAFVNRYLRDEKRYARSLADALVDIIRATAM